MKKSGHWPKTEGIYETPTAYDPLAVNMGQLTIFRFTLKCKWWFSVTRFDYKGA